MSHKQLLKSWHMKTFENQAKQETATGKGHQVKKSGRLSTTDTITSVPELRWPNEGYHGVNGRKCIVYDDLSLPEWALGQLSNIFQIQHPAKVRKALLQTIMALKETTLLPWPAYDPCSQTSKGCPSCDTHISHVVLIMW